LFVGLRGLGTRLTRGAGLTGLLLTFGSFAAAAIKATAALLAGLLLACWCMVVRFIGSGIPAQGFRRTERRESGRQRQAHGRDGHGRRYGRLVAMVAILAVIFAAFLTHGAVALLAVLRTLLALASLLLTSLRLLALACIIAIGLGVAFGIALAFAAFAFKLIAKGGSGFAFFGLEEINDACVVVGILQIIFHLHAVAAHLCLTRKVLELFAHL
jgi:hypothetical protein